MVGECWKPALVVIYWGLHMDTGHHNFVLCSPEYLKMSYRCFTRLAAAATVFVHQHCVLVQTQLHAMDPGRTTRYELWPLLPWTVRTRVGRSRWRWPALPRRGRLAGWERKQGKAILMKQTIITISINQNSKQNTHSTTNKDKNILLHTVNTVKSISYG